MGGSDRKAYCRCHGFRDWASRPSSSPIPQWPKCNAHIMTATELGHTERNRGCVGEGSMAAWLKGLLTGCGLTVLTQILWFSVMGITISLSPEVVAAGMAQNLSGLPRKSLTSWLEHGIAPVMDQRMTQLVHTVRIQVDGITLDINRANEYRLQHQLIHDMNASMARYLNHQLKSSAMAHNLTRVLLAHPQELRIGASWGPFSIPVRIRIQ